MALCQRWKLKSDYFRIEIHFDPPYFFLKKRLKSDYFRIEIYLFEKSIYKITTAQIRLF